MKQTTRFIGLVFLGAAAVTAVSVVREIRKRRAQKILAVSSDEGYETAHDIISPDKFSKRAAAKLKYGPVLP